MDRSIVEGAENVPTKLQLTTQDPQTESGLLHLPFELRDMIYHYVFDTASTEQIPGTTGAVSTRVIREGQNLLLACRQIHHEAFALKDCYTHLHWCQDFYLIAIMHTLGRTKSNDLRSIRCRGVKKTQLRPLMDAYRPIVRQWLPALRCIELEDPEISEDKRLDIEQSLQELMGREDLQVIVSHVLVVE